MADKIKTYIGIILLTLLLSGSHALAEATENTKKLANIDILTPIAQENVAALPVKVILKFNAAIDQSTLHIYLNELDVTDKFILSPDKAQGSLTLPDGLRTGTERDAEAIAPNLIKVAARIKDSKNIVEANQHFFLNTIKGLNSTYAVISSGGGDVSLANIATIIFPSDTFIENQSVILSTTTSTETDADFAETTAMFSAGIRMPYEIRINTGNTKPKYSVDAVINVPPEFISRVPPDAELQIFAQIYEDGGEEVLDNFELFESIYSAKDREISVKLPPDAFTDRRTENETFEAVIIIGSTPTKPDLTHFSMPTQSRR